MSGDGTNMEFAYDPVEAQKNTDAAIKRSLGNSDMGLNAAPEKWDAVKTGLSDWSPNSSTFFTDSDGYTWMAIRSGGSSYGGEGGDGSTPGAITGYQRSVNKGDSNALSQGNYLHNYDVAGQHLGTHKNEKTKWTEELAPVLSVLAAPITAMVAPGLGDWIGNATGLGTQASSVAANTLVKTGLTGLSGGDMGDALASGLIGAGVGMLAPDVSSALADHLGMDPKNAAALTKVAQQYAPQLLRGGLSPQAALSLITKLIPANAGAQR